MNLVICVLIIIILIIILQYWFGNAEGFGSSSGTSPGTILQLYAKGPEDTYLTGDAWKYIPPWFSYNYDWPTYYDYNYRRYPLFKPTRYGKMNYYYYRPYGLRKYYKDV